MRISPTPRETREFSGGGSTTHPAYTTLTIPRFNGTTFTDAFHAKASILKVQPPVDPTNMFPPDHFPRNDIKKNIKKLPLKPPPTRR